MSMIKINKMIITTASFLAVFFISIVFIPTAYSASTVSTINNVSGTISHSNTITISGSGFGSKSTAAPIKYDDFHTFSVGQYPFGNESSGGWSSCPRDGFGTDNPNGPKISSTKYRLASKQKTLNQHFSYTGNTYGSNQAFGFTEITLGHVTEVYFSGWFTFDSTGSLADNAKILNMGGETDVNGSHTFQTRIDVYPTGGWGHIYATTATGCSDNGSYVQNYNPNPDNMLHKNDNVWHRIESYIHLGLSGTGYRDVYMDGVFIGSISGDLTNGTCGLDYFLIGYFYRAMDSSTVANRYWDEIYVDNTRARVEIGNASTWSACTHREIQIPSAWSDNSITVKVNQGTFSNGQAAYLYVVNANGTLNTSGYPLTFGQGQSNGSDTTSPSSPTGVNITILQ